MDAQLCSKTLKCPIFNGVLKGTEYTETYKKLYCKAGDAGRQKCRRYQVSQKAGMCPPKVLPNSAKTVDEIVANMKAEDVI